MTIRISRRAALAGGLAALAAPPFSGLAGAARAETAGAAPSTAYTRKVGDLEVIAISDGYFEAVPSQLFINIAPEDLEAVLTAAYLDPAKPARLGVTAHLVRGGGRTMLIDTGTADLFGPTLGRLPAALAALGVAPETVDAVLLSHMHPDHLGGLLAADAPAFPNATVHVDQTDLAFWTDEATASKAPEGMQPFFARARATAAAYGDRIMPFTGEAEVLPGVTSVPLPGHTVGHTGFRLTSGDAGILIFADAANSSAIQFSHPEAGLTFDTDPALAAETRRKLFDMARHRPDAGRRHPPALPRHRPRGAIGGRLRLGAGGVAVPCELRASGGHPHDELRPPAAAACATRAKARGPARRAMPSLALVVSWAAARLR